eukprot:12957733-Heterocapsa_arctica.AAC.1
MNSAGGSNCGFGRPGGGRNEACSSVGVWLLTELATLPPLAAAASSSNVAGTVLCGIRSALVKLSCRSTHNSRG